MFPAYRCAVTRVRHSPVCVPLGVAVACVRRDTQTVRRVIGRMQNFPIMVLVMVGFYIHLYFIFYFLFIVFSNRIISVSQYPWGWHLALLTSLHPGVSLNWQVNHVRLRSHYTLGPLCPPPPPEKYSSSETGRFHPYRWAYPVPNCRWPVFYNVYCTLTFVKSIRSLAAALGSS
jgi:hypothetical protein